MENVSSVGKWETFGSTYGYSVWIYSNMNRPLYTDILYDLVKERTLIFLHEHWI